MKRVAAIALALPLLACSAILHPENNPIYCMGTGADDTCIPFGMMCVDGICQPADAGMPVDGCGQQEICNGADDNCNGLVDEGSANDADGDGYTFCGTVSPTVPGPTMAAYVDCNDSDPSVHPGAPEICDGKDNNCNGMIDEGMGICPGDGLCSVIAHMCFAPGDCTNPDPGQACMPGFMCDTTTTPPHCVTGDCTLSGSCPGGSRCNPDTHACVMPAPNGSPCAGDTDCASGLCFDATALALPMPPPGGRVCGQACCGDTDCAATEICWAPGTGARSCLPRPLVGRTAFGNGVSGSSCSMATDCRSGLCDHATGCVGDCGADAECMGLTCALTGPIAIGGSGTHHVLSCVTAPSDAGHPGDACCVDSDCGSGICLDAFPPGPGCYVMGECSTACRTTHDCPRSFDFAPGYCTYGHTMDTMDALQVCFYRYGSGGAGTMGASCSATSECRDGDCEGGTCHDACCVDGDCTGGSHCRPGTGSFPSMRCR